MMRGSGLSRRAALAAPLAAMMGNQVNAQPARPFVLATFGGLWEKILREQLIPPFERQHGVTVALELGVGSTFLPKVVAGRTRSPYAVVSCNDDEAFLGQDLGLWLPDQSAQLTNVGSVHPQLRPPAAPLYAQAVYAFPLLYPPAKMPAPTSWGDLWRPGITVGVPHISDSYGLTFLYIAALLNGGDAGNLAPGFEAIRRVPRFKIFKGVTQGFAMYQQREVDAGLFHWNRALLLRQGGLDIAWARPREGVWGQRTGCQIPKGSPSPDLARAWIDYSLSVPYQAAFAAALYTPSNRQVALPAELAAQHLSDAEIDALAFPPWHVINPQRDALLDQWTRAFG
jgi:putative spermidine/putrescine transport system substrate-binding protein